MHPNSDRRRRSLFVFSVKLVIIGLALALTTRLLIAQVYFVPSGSMRPTLQVGDRVLVEKLSQWWRAPARGDVVAFDGTDVWSSAANGRLLAKRVIGVGGDHVRCCDADGRIAVNGRTLNEPYASGHTRPFDLVVPVDRLWLLGDDREHSQDSSSFQSSPAGGSVPVNHVLGRVVAVVWPLTHAGILGQPGTENPNDAH